MHRREVLATCATLLPLVGCLAPEGTTGDDPTETPTTDENTTETTTTENEPDGVSYQGADLEVQSVDCTSGQHGSATATVDNDTVVIQGTIKGRDGCYVAKLATVVHDEAANELRVVVESVDESDSETACMQCTTAIEYTVTARFDGGHPDRVVVSHRLDGETSEVADVNLDESAG